MSEPADRSDRPARTRLPPELRRAQIVEAAVGVFCGRDPAEVTFEEIADAAGVSRALVYNYFGDRGGLLGATCIHCFELLDRAIEPAFDPSFTRAEQAGEWVRRYVLFAVTNPGPWSLIGSASNSHHPAVQQAREQRSQQIAARWGSGPGVRLVVAAVQGMLQAAILEYERCDGDVEFEDFVDLLGVLLWKGLSRVLPADAPIASNVGR